MKRFFYFIAVLLALTWVLAFFIFHVGAEVHILILLAITVYLHAVLTMTTQKVYTARNERRKIA
jgi:hypothetical protein